MAEFLDGIDDVVARMESEGAGLTDARRYFHETYLRTIAAVGEEIGRGGFLDPQWVTRWDVAFAGLYLDALAADRRAVALPGPWRVAFDAARRLPDAPPLRHVLFGLNAHINYDLPQALVAVITPEEFDDPDVVRSRRRDHGHVDTVLQARVGAEDVELNAISRVSLLDRALRPANRVASRRFLTEAREKVWRNAATLDQARRDGEQAYAVGLGVLESLCAERVRDLTRPGPVLLRLARGGFGVVIPAP